MTSDPSAVVAARPLGAVDRPGGSTGGRVAGRLAAASVLAVVAAIGCYVLMVHTALGQRLDDAAFQGARAQYGAAAAADSSQLQRMTADSLAVVLVILVGIGAARRRLRLGLGAAFAAGIAVVGTDVLKSRVLTRPDLLGATSSPLANTFPSGHTATAVACAMALVLVVPPRWRGVAAVVAGAYGWVTAAQVQTAGWHRPSDAVGAALLAFAAVTAVAAVLAATRPVRWPQRRRHRGAMAVLVLVGLVDAAIIVRGLVQVVGYLHAHALGLPVSAGIRHDAYVTGVTVTVEIVVVLLMVLLALLGGVDLDERPRPSRPAGTGNRRPLSAV